MHYSSDTIPEVRRALPIPLKCKGSGSKGEHMTLCLKVSLRVDHGPSVSSVQSNANSESATTPVTRAAKAISDRSQVHALLDTRWLWYRGRHLPELKSSPQSVEARSHLAHQVAA